MLGERLGWKDKGFSKEIWNDSNKLDCSNLLSSFVIKQFQWVVFLPHSWLRIRLDRLDSRSQEQLFPRSTKPKLAFSPVKYQGNATMPVPRKSGLTRLSPRGKKTKTSLPPEPDRSVAYGNFVPWIFAWYKSAGFQEVIKVKDKLGQPCRRISSNDRPASMQKGVHVGPLRKSKEDVLRLDVLR